MAQLTPIRGFTNTPVTKSACIISTVLALALSILQIKHYVRLSIDPFIIEYSQFWRIITYQLSVINESDYLFVILLWFYFKNIERFYGSRKYLSIITVFALYNAFACFIFMCFGQITTYYVSYFVSSVIFRSSHAPAYSTTLFNEVASGPIGILSSLYVCYGHFIPTSYSFTILLANPVNSEESDQIERPRSGGSKELTLSNHFAIHLVYTLFLFNNGTKSIIPCLVGLFIGKLHTFELLPASRAWLIPYWAFRLTISPIAYLQTQVNYLGAGFRNPYFAVGETREDNAVVDNNEDDELDENRAQRNQIRAETPVRPLGTQFLDTFRS